MKDVTCRRIGLSLIALSIAVAFSCMFVFVVKLVPPAVDALLNHQLQVSMQSRGVEDMYLVEARQ